MTECATPFLSSSNVPKTEAERQGDNARSGNKYEINVAIIAEKLAAANRNYLLDEIRGLDVSNSGSHVLQE
jgi:hypothetical protein